MSVIHKVSKNCVERPKAKILSLFKCVQEQGGHFEHLMEIYMKIFIQNKVYNSFDHHIPSMNQL